jgi:hypothetical protein
LKKHQHTSDMTPPQRSTATSAPRRLGARFAVTGALVSWLAIAWLAISAVGVVAGIALAVWGMPLVALTAIFRLDARASVAPAPESKPGVAEAPRAPAAPAPVPAYAGVAAKPSTHAA